MPALIKGENYPLILRMPKRTRPNDAPNKRPMKKGRTTFKKKATSRNVLIGSEKKFFDSSSVTDASTTVTVVPLNSMAAGDTALTRDGNKILCKSIQLRIAVQNESLSENNIFRYVVVHDKNANGVSPTGAQVFEGTPNVYSMKNISNASRFRTLLDQVMPINNTSDTAGCFRKEYFDHFITIPEDLQLTQYADGTADVPISGSLSLLYLSDVVSGVTDLNVIDSNRLRFVG